VSDDPTALKDLMISTAQQHGWIVAIATSTWAVILRFLIGRYQRERRLLATRLGRIEGLLIRYDERLNNIEDRSRLRRRGDPPDRDRESDHDDTDEG
jgi:hypothetical protein